MQETELYSWWQYYGRSGESIKNWGCCLRVLDCGTLNMTRGPDFIAARFELDGIVYQGDVECHHKPADWYVHNHHLDKAYRQVVLHLVAQSGIHPPVKSQWSQQPIRTLALPKPKDSTGDPTKICQPNSLYQKNLRSNLIRLAFSRFGQKVNRFIKALNSHNYHALFYAHFFRILGYPENANTFQLLAEQLNWAWLMHNKKFLDIDHRQFLAIYAGLAGFIPSNCADNYSITLKQLYKENSYLLPGKVFNADLWQYAGTRPNNHPHFRLATGLQILMHYNFELLDILFAHLQMRRELKSAQKAIYALFKLHPELYWTTHYALGRKRKGSLAKVIIGEARISELLINTVLPLAAAQAEISGSEGYYAYIQSLYLGLPLVSVYGSFQRQMPWLNDCLQSWPAQAVNQSLLFLQSDYCRYLSCSQCPLNRRHSQLTSKIIDNKIKNI